MKVQTILGLVATTAAFSSFEHLRTRLNLPTCDQVATTPAVDSNDPTGTCGGRSTWLMNNLGMTQAEATTRLVSEGFTVCNCGDAAQPSAAPLASSSSSCTSVADVAAPDNNDPNGTCGGRSSWLVANLGMSLDEATARLVSEGFTQCNCGEAPATAPPTAVAGPKCGGAVNAGWDNCAAGLWTPTNDISMACYAYGGSNDPCSLNNNNDPNDGLDKDPSQCTESDTFYLWDEPDTQGRSYAWAGSAWLDYSSRWSTEIMQLRQRGVRFTSPLLKADNMVGSIADFYASCGDACTDRGDAAYIDIIAANPFCGDWNLPSGTVEGCRNGANWILGEFQRIPQVNSQNVPVYLTNWAYLGGTEPSDQVPAIQATDAFFAAGSPVQRVYWFGATDFGGGTAGTSTYLISTVEAGPSAGSTLGELWAEECHSL